MTKSPLRTLVIGADGLVGAALYEQLPRRGHIVFGTTRRRGQPSSSRKLFLDLAEPVVTADQLPDADVAILCTAVASFAECRKQPELARRVSATAPAALARQLMERGMFVVRLSSAAVFRNATPMAPESQPSNSRALYGRLQAEGERLLQALGPAVSIIRFTKIVTPSLPVMARWIAALLRGETIEAFEDHGFCPVTLDCSVDALIGVIEQRRPGIYQVSASYDLSYVELAIYLVDRLGLPRERIVPVRAADRGMPKEEIALYSSLDSKSLTALTGFAQPDPYAVLDAIFGPTIERTRAQIGRSPMPAGRS